MNDLAKNLLLWLIVAVVLMAVFQSMSAPVNAPSSELTYNQFIDDIAACGVHCFVMEPTTDMAYIAERYGKTPGQISKAIAIGEHAEKFLTKKLLPVSELVLYELTTLDDDGFRLLCKPDTTQATIKEYKDMKKAPDANEHAGMVKLPAFATLATSIGALKPAAGGVHTQEALAAFESAYGKPYPKKGSAKVFVTDAEMEAIKAVLLLQAKSKTTKEVITEASADLKPSAKQKLDKAIAVAAAAQRVELLAQMQKQVAEVKVVYEEKAKHLDTVVYPELMETKAEVEAELTRVQHQRSLSANTHITGEEFQFLLQATHPDKFDSYGDPQLTAKMQKVFAILQKLAPALNTKMQTKKMVQIKDGEIMKSKKEIRDKVIKISELEEKIEGLTEELQAWEEKKEREER